MPHVSSVSGAGDDLGSTDEVKVFKEEGEDEKRSSENLTEDKTSLIDLTESQEKSVSPNSYNSNKNASRSDLSPVFGECRTQATWIPNYRKLEPTPHTSSFNMGYLVSPYPYANGTTGSLPVSMVSPSCILDSDIDLESYNYNYNLNTLASKMGLGAAHPFFVHNGDPLGQPPPAHMGIPPYHLDKAAGLSRPSMYPFSAGQYPYPILSPDMTAASWHSPYPTISSGASGFRGPYPSSLPITSTSLPSDFYRFSPTSLMAAHPGLSPHSHPAIVTPGPKQELLDHNHRSHHSEHKNSSSSNNNSDTTKSQESSHSNNNSNSNDKKKPHIKKPLNAFMLYMKEMRAKVVAECTLKESAAINQILGRRWHSLSREEQAKYYEKARQERQLHMELYPGWSARDNYGYGAKKKKRKKERTPIIDTNGGNSMKKCRARYGLDQQSQWCKPCSPDERTGHLVLTGGPLLHGASNVSSPQGPTRKKRCIRYVGKDDGNQSEDNLGSCGSIGTPPDDDMGSISSPGGLSGLSSLTSPSMILPSPSSLASPCMSLQSPLTPHTLDIYDVKPPMPVPLILPTRNPVGTNPHDINNPLSVNQLVKSPAPPHSSANKTHHPISVT
uniref:dTCF n=1 Tax=Cacopsylla melanoneura TaxID=428564 RepID=A0A8D9E0B0_9HEMI